MKKLIAAAIAAAAIASTAAIAAPQPQGFDQSVNFTSSAPAGFANNAPNTVAGIKANAHDDQRVVLQGRLTNYLGKDIYEFTDLAGDTIEVELDDDRNWSNISKDQLIEIEAEVDKDLLSISLDVKRARPVQAQ